MTGQGGMLAIGPCFSCEQPFAFDPDTIQSVPIDPVTGLPPDLGGDPARARNEPICAPCRRLANPIRVKAGLAPFPIPEDHR
ncbi:MAG: hypothetical protein ACRDRO_21475 [Pseudonocardiaceae bacterium]